jgi:hypothetical protein
MNTNYKEIYFCLIKEKFPEKLEEPKVIWRLEHLDSALKIIELNDLLFHNGIRESNIMDSRLRSYTDDEIIKILKYQLCFKKAKDRSSILDFEQDSGKVIVLHMLDTWPNNPIFGSIAYDKVIKSMVI